MWKITIQYSDTSMETKTFADLDELYRFLHNEGDHVIEYWVEDEAVV